jgi:glutamate racemase
VVGRDVVLVSSADETAFEMLSLLQWSDLARDPADGLGRHTFLSSGDVDWFRELGGRLLGPEVSEVGRVDW